MMKNRFGFEFCDDFQIFFPIDTPENPNFFLRGMPFFLKGIHPNYPLEIFVCPLLVEDFPQKDLYLTTVFSQIFWIFVGAYDTNIRVC